jgi:hypothetical protein
MTLIPVEVDETEAAEVESSTKGKGEYKAALLDFLASGKARVKFPEPADGKPTATSIKSGFENAIKSLTKDNDSHPAATVKVRNYEKAVYLLRGHAAAPAEAAQVDTAPEAAADSTDQ